MKKAVTFMMTIFAAVTLCAAAHAADGNDWIYADDGKTITAYNGNGGDVTIPAGSIVGGDIRFRGEGIFSNSKNDYVTVDSLTVEDGVTFKASPFGAGSTMEKIVFNNKSDNDEIYYFPNYENLKYIKLPDGIEDVRGCRDCPSLETVVLPDGVKNIGSDAFSECLALNEINMPASIEAIGEKAFYKCESLKEVYLSKNIKSIGKDAFWYCFGIETVTAPSGCDLTEIPLGGVVTFNYDGELTWRLAEQLYGSPWITKNYYDKNALFIIDGHLLRYSGSDKNVKIPSEVKYISPNAFFKSPIESVELPNGLVEIGMYAFDRCTKLKGIVIPASVEKIGEFAFEDCSSLQSLKVEGKTLIEGGAFTYTALTKDSIQLADGAVYDGVVKDVEYPSDPLIYLYSWYDESSTPVPNGTEKPEAAAKPSVSDKPEATSDPNETDKPDTPLSTPSPTASDTADTYKVGDLDIPYDLGNAERLAALGLFYGTDHGFALDEKVTRAQAAVMVLRMIGEEGNENEGAASPFLDTRGHWAEASIAKAYDLKIVSGTSADTFEPERGVTGREFVRMLLGAMGYDNITIENAYDKGLETQVLLNNFTKTVVRTDGYALRRNDMAGICHSALTAKTADGKWLKDKLIEKGVFDERLFENIMMCSIPIAPIK